MLSKRQEQILNILKAGGWKTGKEIASLLGVTSRTVRNDINDIRSFDPNLIESSVRNGYRYASSCALCETSYQQELPQTGKDRRKYILLKLLTDEKTLNLMQLSNDLYVSSNTIDNDLSEIRRELKQYPDLKLLRRNGMIYLTGNEQSKRHLYKEMLAFETAGNFLNLNELDRMYENFNLLEIKEILESVFEEYDYKIREEVFPVLMIHIGVALDRMLKKNLVQSVQYDVDSVKQEKEYEISKKFYELVSHQLQIEYNENECILLAVLLIGRRSGKMQDPQELQLDFDLNDLIDEIIERICINYEIDFSEDENLKVGLSLHITNLIGRIHQNVIIENVFLKEIKRTYPLVFEMAVFVGKIIEEKGLKVSEEELGFLALHLGAAYDRLNLNQYYHAVLIQPSNIGLANLCKNKILDHFSERLVIDATLQYFEKAQIKSLDPDLIITTVGLQHDLEIPTIQISMFVNENDEFKIFKALNRLDRERLREGFSKRLKGMIKDEFYYTDLNLSTKEDVLSFLCEDMIKQNVVNEDFLASVLDREQLSATSFSLGFAVPHPLHCVALSSTISIALLKDPIPWGEHDVKIIFLLAVNRQDQDAFKLFLDWLSEVSSHPELLAKIYETKSAQEFIDLVTMEQEDI